jgi:hypothetical protein
MVGICGPYNSGGSATNLDARTIEEVPIVQEYPDVFPEELPRMPLDRDIEFIIDLIPGTTPIAKRPYRMAPAKLADVWSKTE